MMLKTPSTVLSKEIVTNRLSMLMESHVSELNGWRTALAAKVVGCLLLTGASLAPLPGCSRDQPEPTQDESLKPEQKIPQRVHFPQALRVQDHLVNELVEKAMNACADGDYHAFRLLWTARQEPMPRREFDNGWEAVTRIEVLALEPIKLAASVDKPQPADDRNPAKQADAYAIFAKVQLDPNSRPGALEPHRTAITVIIKESGEWKLAHAPKAVRRWLREKVGPAAADSDATVTKASAGSPDATP